MRFWCLDKPVIIQNHWYNKVYSCVFPSYKFFACVHIRFFYFIVRHTCVLQIKDIKTFNVHKLSAQNPPFFIRPARRNNV